MKNKDLTKTIEVTLDKKPKKEKKNIFKKMKEKWQTFSKKRKILIITLIALVIIAIGFLLYIFVFLDEQQKIVVAKDNFIYENGQLKLLDENEREIGIYNCENKDPKLCYVAYEDVDDDFDVEKTVYENGKALEIRSKIYENKYVFIHDNVDEDADKIILYDIKGNKNVDEFYGIKSYINNKENYLVLKNDDKKSAFYKIGKDLEEIIEFKYDYLGMIDSKKESLVATNDGEWLIIDFDNDELSSKFSEEIKNYNEKHIVLKSSANKYRVVEYKSIEVLKDLDYVELEDEILLVVMNNKLNIVDYDNNNLIHEPIDLYNNYYVKTIEIDEDHKILATKQSYRYELDKQKIDIFVYDDKEETDYYFNLLEGYNNIDRKYYSYFDGDLHIYANPEKTRYLGKYVCSNSNEIDSVDSELSNCYPALDKANNLTIPMFYERFIFIYDAPAKTNDDSIKVNLYDIRDNKVLGNYIEVESANGTKEFKNIAEDYFVIATNKNKKQGLLKIAAGRVTKAVDFSYDELVKINNIYLKAKKDSDLIIVSNAGVEDKDAFVNGYYRVKNDRGNYDVYTKEDKKVLNNSFAYIKLYDKFLAAASDTNMLFVYDYNGTRLTREDIPVHSPTEFEIKTEENKAFIKSRNVTHEYDTSTIPWSLPKLSDIGDD